MKNILVLLLLVIATTSHGQSTFEKNGLPCISEICIGDSISELRRINWDKLDTANVAAALKSGPAAQHYKEEYAKQYRGEIKSAVYPYLYRTAFDGQALNVLELLRAGCAGSERLRGEFSSPNGNWTKVGIALMAPTPESNDHKWIVTSISRFIDVADQAQDREVKNQLSERYKRFITTQAGSYTTLEKGAVSISDGSSPGGSQRFVRYDLLLSLPYGKQLEKAPPHPACAKKVTVD